MKAVLVALALSSTTGCFTAAGAALGAQHEEPDGSTNMTTTIGYALAGALVDSMLFTFWVLSDFDLSTEDDSDFRRTDSPLSMRF